jgi:hypothetical protein
VDLIDVDVAVLDQAQVLATEADQVAVGDQELDQDPGKDQIVAVEMMLEELAALIGLLELGKIQDMVTQDEDNKLIYL